MLTNNDILKKLRVALNLRSEEILAILKLADFDLSESELKAFFRSEEDANYREAGDQVLRRFLDGLIIKNRGKKEEGGDKAPQESGKQAAAPQYRPRRPQEPPRVKRPLPRSGKERQQKAPEQDHGRPKQ